MYFLGRADSKVHVKLIRSRILSSRGETRALIGGGGGSEYSCYQFLISKETCRAEQECMNIHPPPPPPPPQLTI